MTSHHIPLVRAEVNSRQRANTLKSCKTFGLALGVITAAAIFVPADMGLYNVREGAIFNVAVLLHLPLLAVSALASMAMLTKNYPDPVYRHSIPRLAVLIVAMALAMALFLCSKISGPLLGLSLLTLGSAAYARISLNWLHGRVGSEWLEA